MRLKIKSIVSLCGAVGLMLVFGMQPMPSDGFVGPFCGERVAHDYERPFKRMPDVKSPPPTGQLPFAPRGVVLRQPKNSILISEDVGKINFGVGFAVSSNEHRIFHLNWNITVRLLEVNYRGKAKKVVVTKKLMLGTLTDQALERVAVSLSIPKKPGFYRLDLSFADADGRQLANYGRYLRTVRAKYAARLRVDKRVVYPGEDVLFRLENLGTQRIAFGEPFSLEQLTEGNWTTYSLPLGPWHLVRLGLGAGEAGKCQSFSIPTDFPLGRYRLRKDLLNAASLGAKPLTSEFEVRSWGFS